MARGRGARRAEQSGSPIARTRRRTRSQARQSTSAPANAHRVALPAAPLPQAAYSVQTVLISLQTLLGDPNNASPLNGQAAQLWSQPAEYRRTVLKRYKEATGSAPDA